MKLSVLASAALAGSLWTASPATAQDAPREADRVRAEIEQVVVESGVAAALEEAVAATLPSLQESLAELATSLEALAARIAEDEELRTSAARAGQGVLDVAEVVVIEQSVALQEALRAMADRIGEIAAERQRER